MSSRTYHTVSGTIFALVALGHLVRAARGLPFVAGAWEVPIAVSWFGALVAALLAYWAFSSRPAS